MYYLLLILLLVILLIISYFIFEKDILSPSVIVCIIYLLSVISAYISKIFKMWNYSELKFKTSLIIIIGIVGFIIGEYVIRFIIKRMKKNKKTKEEFKNKIIKISIYKKIIVLFFVIISFVFIYYKMYKITGIYNNIPKMINDYRHLTPLFNNTKDATSIGTLAMQFYRATELFAFVFSFIFINNLINKDKIKNNIIDIFIILIGIILTLFIGGRTSLLKLLFAIVFFCVVIFPKDKMKKMSRKKIISCILAFLVLLISLFYLIMPLIGRKQNTNFINYISFYAGCPIASFNEVINKIDVGNNKFFGEETFYGPQGIIKKFNIVKLPNVDNTKWIRFGNLYSNVFTGVQPYYSDFGMIGVFVLQLIGAILVTILYKKSKESNLYLIYYSFLGLPIITDQFRAEKVFSTFFSFDAIIYTCYLIVIYMFLFKLKEKELKWREKKNY